jgi:hypothetical protein
MPVSYPTSKEAQLEFWKRKIQYGIDYWKPIFEPCEILINQYNNDAATTREREEIRRNLGDQTDPGLRTKSNIVFGYIDQSIANVAAHNPKFSVTPFTKASIGSERVVAKVSDYWYRETDQLRQDKRVLLDAYLAPFGAKKLGYTSDIEGQLITDTTINPGRVIQNPVDESLFIIAGEITTVMQDQNHVFHNETHTQFLQQPDITPRQAELLIAHMEDHTYFLEHPDAHRNTTVKWESPYGVRWGVGDVLIDPLASDGIADAGWVAFRWVRHVDDVIYDGSLNTDGLEPNHRMDRAPEVDVNKFLVDDFGLVEGWEIFARGQIVGESSKKNLWIDLTKDHGSFLRYEDEWPIRSIEDYPLELLAMQDGVRHWHTKGPMLMGGGDSMQSLVNEILDSYLSVIRKQKNLFLYDPAYIKEEEIDAILQAEDMESFEVEGLVQAQGRAVQAIQFGDVPPEKGQILNLVQQMFDRSNGTPQPINLPKTDSATEANIHDRRATAREDEKAQKFAKYQLRCARKFWQMTTEFRPERLFLIDPKAVEEVRISKEMAQGEYGFEMDISSAATAIAVERKQSMDLIGLMQQIDPILKEQNNGVGSDIGELVKDLLIRGYLYQDPERILPFLDNDSNTEVINPLADTQGGGITPQAVTETIAQRATGGPTPSAPVPTPSALEADSLRVDRGGTRNIQQNAAEGQ